MSVSDLVVMMNYFSSSDRPVSFLEFHALWDSLSIMERIELRKGVREAIANS